MSRRRPNGEENATERECAVVLADAFQKVLQLQRQETQRSLQETMSLQQQEVEHRLQETMKRQQQEVEHRLQETKKRQQQEVDHRLQETKKRQQQEVEHRLQEIMKRQQQEGEHKFQETMKRQQQEVEHKFQETMKRQQQAVERKVQETMKRQQQEEKRMLQETMKRQDQKTEDRLKETERRLLEALSLQEGRAASALRGALAQMEFKIQEKNDAIRDLEQQLDEFETGEVVTDCKAKDLEAAVQRLDDRVRAVEASLQRAMQTFFPRVDGLLRQLEENTSPGATSSDSPPSTSAGDTSAGTSKGGRAEGVPEESPSPTRTYSSISSFFFASTFYILSVVCPLIAAVVQWLGWSKGEDAEEKRERQRMGLRMMVEKERMRISRASPCRLSEDLMTAVSNKRREDVIRLLDAGADINYISHCKHTPLQWAVPCTEMVKLLLQRGADVNADNGYGDSAINMATCSDKSGQCLDLLIGAGGDVTRRNFGGITPLHWAVHNNNHAAVRALLSAGAKTDVKSWDGCWKNKRSYDLGRTPEIKYHF